MKLCFETNVTQSFRHLNLTSVSVVLIPVREKVPYVKCVEEVNSTDRMSLSTVQEMIHKAEVKLVNASLSVEKRSSSVPKSANSDVDG
ncbi:hypothetical protein EUTSA_v10028006mg [Eutrema salsugineum]|uniref:Uncharacterized protein n=1 Tax=Eutrema salsugineum TaxID=72664 RepID=V4L8Z6_EUTSA|nr:hypothetical protein EUTSA_v10028006mg [Eutrema salsugineum]